MVHSGYGKLLIILGSILIFSCGLIACSHEDTSATIGGSSSELAVNTEKKKPVDVNDLKNTVLWQDNQEKIEAFKQRALSNVSQTVIGEMFGSSVEVKQWQYGTGNSEEYLRCVFSKDDLSCELIFYTDVHNNTNVAEYYINGNRQTSADMLNFCASGAKKDMEFSQKRIGFFSNGNYGIEIKEINWEKREILYDGYQFENSLDGPVCSDMTLEIFGPDTMADTDIIWNGDDEFTITDGDDAVFMTSMVGGYQDYDMSKGAGTYVRCDRNEEMRLYLEKHPVKFTKENIPIAGYFICGSEEGLPYIVIDDVADASFSFTIYDEYGEVIFNTHTATAVGESAAVYIGTDYNVSFDVSDTEIKVYGCENVIGDIITFVNAEALGVS